MPVSSGVVKVPSMVGEPSCFGDGPAGVVDVPADEVAHRFACHVSEDVGGETAWCDVAGTAERTDGVVGVGTQLVELGWPGPARDVKAVGAEDAFELVDEQAAHVVPFSNRAQPGQLTRMSDAAERDTPRRCPAHL